MDADRNADRNDAPGPPSAPPPARPSARPSARRPSSARRPCLRAALAMATCTAAFGAGCRNYPYDPTKATRPYPLAAKQERVADIQVIPDPGNGVITLVNPTAVSYRDFDLWVNRRYVRHVESLAAGESVTLQIDSFWDERGEGPFPGGWFRYFAPTPIVLVQIQEKPDGPLVGLISKPPDSPQR